MSKDSLEVGVGIVGGGQGCLELLQLFDHFPLEEFQARILGVADPRPDAPGICYARDRGLIVTKDFTEFYSHPEIKMIIELTGNNEVLEKIFRTKPAHLKVIDHVGARLFWDLMRLKADKRARGILESTRDAFIVVGTTGNLMQYNKAAELMLGDHCHLYVGKPVRELVEEIFGVEGVEMVSHGSDAIYNLTAYQGTPHEFPAEVSLFKVEIEEENCLVFSIRDVSERLQAEQEISRLHRYELLFNNVATEFALSQDVWQSLQYAVRAIGESFEADWVSLWYMSPHNHSLVGKGEWHSPGFSSRAGADGAETVMAKALPFIWENVRAANMIKVHNVDILPEPDRTTLREMELKSLVGIPIIGESSPWGVLFMGSRISRFWSAEEIELLSTVVNIIQNTIQREEAREALQESEALYQVMVDKSLTGIYIIRGGVMLFINKRMADIFGYAPEEIVNKSPINLVHPDDHWLVIKRMEERLQGTVPSVHYTFRGVKKTGEIIWLECMGSRLVIKGQSAIIGNVMDVTERIQNERNRSLMFDAITMLAVGMVEQRDPYTAGHQRRVASIAVAIGRKMGLPECKLEGLRLAALLHDIGKFAVPIEILTKPGKLRPSEFQFIQLHSQVGAEILAEVPFPWDISSIVKQHHERLDGSGYPRHLRGDQISLEAKIIAVADVVEAMSSHRPYRPSLGLEAALQEVVENSGKLYDPDVVAALLAVAKELDIQ